MMSWKGRIIVYQIHLSRLVYIHMTVSRNQNIYEDVSDNLIAWAQTTMEQTYDRRA